MEQGRRGGRGHRHLVRPRTFPDDGRGLWSKRPSPPLFPRQGRSAPSRGGRTEGSESDGNRTFFMNGDRHRYDRYGVGSTFVEEAPLRRPEFPEAIPVVPEDSEGWASPAEALDGWLSVDETNITGRGQRGMSGPGLLQASCRSELEPYSHFSRPATPYRVRGSRSGRGPGTNRASLNGHDDVSPRRRRSRTGRLRSRHHQLCKRPQWDARFWVPAGDALPAVGTAVEQGRYEMSWL